jgi:hypothetical protein
MILQAAFSEGGLTESGYNDNLRTIGNQFTECLRESQIPADQHSDPTDRRVNGCMAFLSG